MSNELLIEYEKRQYCKYAGCHGDCLKNLNTNNPVKLCNGCNEQIEVDVPVVKGYKQKSSD